MPLVLIAALLTVIGLGAFGAFGSEKAYACSCAMFESYVDALETSSHVLDATVVAVKEKNQQQDLDVTLSVTAVWKGEAEHEMHVVTSSNSASCGYAFEAGQRYAVFANEYDGELHVSLCSATSELFDDSPIFQELGQPKELPVDRDHVNGELLSASPESTDPLSPEQIKLNVSEEELQQQLDTRKSQLLLVFAAVGGLLLVAAVVMLMMRRRR